MISKRIWRLQNEMCFSMRSDTLRKRRISSKSLQIRNEIERNETMNRVLEEEMLCLQVSKLNRYKLILESSRGNIKYIKKTQQEN